jgi:uncharacterized membrane protein YeiH
MTPLIFSQFGFLTLGVLGYIDLIAATTNAFNGALLARRPSHYKHFTLMGVILLAYAGGIGGGVLRDILLNKVPSPLTNPWYLIACFAAAGVALLITFRREVKFQDGLFQFMTAFSLPWYAIVGADAAVTAHLGYFAAVVIGVIGTTGGRFIIDISCGVIPQQLVRGGFWVLTAAMTGALYLVCKEAIGLSVIISTAIAFVFGFGFRLTSQALGWEEWEPWEPAELKAGEKGHKTLIEGLRAEFDPKNTSTPKQP